ncbi:MAG TPA: hypothetical protein VH682_04990, partial [Gemmataceae bacterium]
MNETLSGALANSRRRAAAVGRLLWLAALAARRGRRWRRWRRIGRDVRQRCGPNHARRHIV